MIESRARKIAQSIFDNKMKHYRAKHEFVEVNLRDYPHLSKNFYETTTAQLKKLEFTNLYDVKDLLTENIPPKTRTLLRILTSQDQTINAVILQVKPESFLWRFLIFIFRMQSKSYDIETELNDGSFLTSTITQTSTNKIPDSKIRTFQYPKETSIKNLFLFHKENLEKILRENPEVSTRKLKTVQEICDSQNRQQKIKESEFFENGGFTKDFISQYVKKNKNQLNEIYSEIQNMLKEEENKDHFTN